MLFSSATFLFAFLPAVTLLYYIIPARFRTARNMLLTLVSILFYAWGEPRFVVVMLAMIAVNWALALLAEAQGDKYRRMVLVTAVAVNISLLFVFKYLTFVLENTNRFSGPVHSCAEHYATHWHFVFYLSSNVLCDRCLPRGWQGAKKYLECDALYCVFSAADCRANRALLGFCRPNQLPNGKL